eukprot:jgi/Mesvir1/25542/Mv01786-RA.4
MSRLFCHPVCGLGSCLPCVAGGLGTYSHTSMLHGVRIKDGKVNYVNRYVKTQRFATEEEAGGPVYPTMGDFAGFSAILRMHLTSAKKKLGMIHSGSGGTANTALIFHGKALLALNEGDIPYAVRVMMDGELETLGLQSYGGQLKHNVTAHPKVDAETGELFFFGYNMMKQPYIKYGVASKDAELQFCGVPITIEKPVMMHDFAITKRFAIFMDLPLLFDGKVMVKEGKLPFVFDKSRPSRFGLLPRYARDESEIKWFVLNEACYIFHTANAWEEGDDIVKLVACPSPNVDLNLAADITLPSVVEYTFQLSTGQVTQRRLSDTRMDFPRVNDALTGRKSRFIYGAIFGAGASSPRIDGIVKLDVDLPGEDAAEVGKIIYGEQRYGGEPVFVPRAGGTSEDDGFLLVFVHDETTGKSEFAAFDAKTMAPEPVARVVLPHRVPYGFHGLFVSEVCGSCTLMCRAGTSGSFLDPVTNTNTWGEFPNPNTEHVRYIPR